MREDEKGNQGLKNAVVAAGQAGNAADVTWVGTLGIATNALESSPEKVDIDDCLQHEHECLVVYCTDKVFEGHTTITASGSSGPCSTPSYLINRGIRRTKTTLGRTTVRLISCLRTGSHGIGKPVILYGSTTTTSFSYHQ